MAAVKHLLSLYDLPVVTINDLLTDSDTVLDTQAEGTTKSVLSKFSVAIICWTENKQPDAYDDYITTSFKAAAEGLGADCIVVNPDHNQAPLAAVDLINDLICAGLPHRPLKIVIIRHPKAGVPNQLKKTDLIVQNLISVVNGGDGFHENPTEALTYIKLILKRYGRIKNLRCVLVGDLRFSPEGRSLFFGLSKLGADIHVVAPPGLAPDSPFEEFPFSLHNNFSSVGGGINAVLSIPIDTKALEQGIIASRKEYLDFYSLAQMPLGAIDENGLIVRCGPQTKDLLDPAYGFGDMIKMGHLWSGASDEDVLAIRMAALRYCLRVTIN